MTKIFKGNLSAIDFIAKFLSVRFGMKCRPAARSGSIEYEFILKQIRANLPDLHQVARKSEEENSILFAEYAKMSRDTNFCSVLSSYFSKTHFFGESTNYFLFLGFPFFLEGSSHSDILHNENVLRELERDICFSIYRDAGISSLEDLHNKFLHMISLSFIAKTITVFEVDFSHKNNIVPKYTFDCTKRTFRKIWGVNENVRLYINQEIHFRITDNVWYNSAEDATDFFSFDENKYDRSTILGQLGADISGHTHFLGMANGSYSCIYLFSEASTLRFNSQIVRSMKNLFESFFYFLAAQSILRIQRNTSRGILRHTIEVQVAAVSKSFSKIHHNATKFLPASEENQAKFNLNLADVYSGLSTLEKDVEKQFSAEYDKFGDLISSPRISKGHVSLIDKKLITALIKEAEKIVRKTHHNCFVNLKVDDAFQMRVRELGVLEHGLREFFTNAAKYNKGDRPIQVRARLQGTEALLVVTNIGPELISIEQGEFPKMGLRGVNSIKTSDSGTGQGLASAFEALHEIGIDASYTTEKLSPEQNERLAVWRNSDGFSYSRHVITLIGDFL